MTNANLDNDNSPKSALKAIPKFCVDCVGGDKNLIRKCHNKFVSGPCSLHQYRFGTRPKTALKKGLDVQPNDKVPPLQACRLKCTFCEGDRTRISDCRNTDCPLWPYRYGENPETARKHGKDVDNASKCKIFEKKALPDDSFKIGKPPLLPNKKPPLQTPIFKKSKDNRPHPEDQR